MGKHLDCNGLPVMVTLRVDPHESSLDSLLRILDADASSRLSTRTEYLNRTLAERDRPPTRGGLHQLGFADGASVRERP